MSWRGESDRDWRGSAPQRELRIALVNNMPDSALAAAERQFLGLIEASRGDLAVSWRLYALSSLRRSAETRASMAARYETIDALMAAPPDVLIVTGAEPREAQLCDEPYWPELTRLIEWARSGGVASALYSCLAAHAAVLIADGVRRRRLPAKLCGVFASRRTQRGDWLDGDGPLLIPHSRYNDLDPRELEEKGYEVLTRSDEAGADVFARDGAALEMFWQGHPEYEADTLAREWRRDLQRFAQTSVGAPPALPKNYFSQDAHAELAAYLARLGEAGAGREMGPPQVALPKEPPPWGESSRDLMRSFLAASLRHRPCATSAQAVRPPSRDLAAALLG